MINEIILIVVGIIIVIISFVLSEKNIGMKQEKADTDYLKNNLEELKENLKLELMQSIQTEQDKIQSENETVLQDRQTDILDKMKDEMSRLSNEKIISFSEYGEQILGKIEQNHQDVVFLYDMLNQKENEMKELIRKTDSSKTNLEEMLIAVKEEEKEWEIWKKEKEEMMQELARKEIALQKVIIEEKKLTEQSEKKKIIQETENEVPAFTATDILQAKKAGKAIRYSSTRQTGNTNTEFREVKIENSMTKQPEEKEMVRHFGEKEKEMVRHFEEKENRVVRHFEEKENRMTRQPEASDNRTNIVDRGPAAHIEGAFAFGEVSMGKQGRNDNSVEFEEKDTKTSVLELYAQGMSVMEIAKILGKGQGEVKLIIDLYQGRKM